MMRASRRCALFGFALLASCSKSGSEDGGHCDPQSVVFSVRTVDGARTIEAVEIKGTGCLLGYDCQPATPGRDAGSTAPCAEIKVLSYGFIDSSCEVKLVSTTGQTVTVSSAIRAKPGAYHRCPQGERPVLEFDPAVITIDFSQGTVVDAAADG